MNMGQWFLQWGFQTAILIFAVVATITIYRGQAAAWVQARGDWKVALQMSLGPWVTTALGVLFATIIFPWAVLSIAGAGSGSAVSKSFYNLAMAGVQAVGGTFTAAEIQIPDAPSLGGLLSENIPSEADLRNVFVGGNSGASGGGQQSVPATNAQASTTWTAPSSAPEKLPLVMAPAILNGEAKAYAPPAMPLVLQAAADKAPVAAPTSIPFIFKAAGNGGGPQAADADAAIAGIGSQTYTVKRGDYATKIANQFGIAASALCRANRAVNSDCNNLRAGMVLTIPGK